MGCVFEGLKNAFRSFKILIFTKKYINCFKTKSKDKVFSDYVNHPFSKRFNPLKLYIHDYGTPES